MLTLREKECYTTMTNFILKHKGAKKPNIKEVRAILEANNAHLLDNSLLPNAVIVEIDEINLPHLKSQLDGEWSIYPEKGYRIPTTKLIIRKKDSGNL